MYNINKLFEEKYNIKYKFIDNSYTDLNTQAMFLIFKAGYIANIEEDNVIKYYHRRWNDK